MRNIIIFKTSIYLLLLCSTSVFTDNNNAFRVKIAASNLLINPDKAYQAVESKGRHLCADILNEYASSGNGYYNVDPDKDGPLQSKEVYCDMEGGGWTLYENFGSLNFTAMSPTLGYSHNHINSREELAEAGYSVLANIINGSEPWGYHIDDFHFQFFEGASDLGYIEKELPRWIEQVRIDTDHQWYGGYNTFTFGNNTYRQDASTPRESIIFNSSADNRLLRIEETQGIVWVEALWVK